MTNEDLIKLAIFSYKRGWGDCLGVMNEVGIPDFDKSEIQEMLKALSEAKSQTATNDAPTINPA